MTLLRAFALFVALAANACAMTTELTYQGFVRDAAGPIDGPIDVRVACFDAATAGAQVGATVERLAVVAALGVFSITADFGAAAFPGADRWLEAQVRRGGGAWTTLSPRQRVTPVPYAQRAAAADALAGFPLAATTPQAGQLLRFDGSSWRPFTPCAFRSGYNDAIGELVQGTNHVVPFTYEDFDIGGVFDVDTSTFTAPVPGIYRIDMQLRFDGGIVGSNVGIKVMTVEPGEILRDLLGTNAYATSGTGTTVGGFSSLIRLDRGARLRPVCGTAYASSGYTLDSSTVNWFAAELVAETP